MSLGHEQFIKRWNENLLHPPEYWLAELTSPGWGKRARAAMILLEFGDENLVNETKMALLNDPSQDLLMTVAFKIVRLTDNDFLHRILRRNDLSEEAGYQIWRDLNRERRVVDSDLICQFRRHISPMVRIAVLDYSVEMGIDLEKQLAFADQIKSSITPEDFIKTCLCPSSIFTDRQKFLRDLRRIKKNLANKLSK